MSTPDQVILVVTADTIGHCVIEGCFVEPLFSGFTSSLLITSLDSVGGQHIQCSDFVLLLTRIISLCQLFQQLNKFIVAFFFVVENLSTKNE